MMDRLLQRFRRSQPWQVVLEPGAVEQARLDIVEAFGPGDAAARDRFLDKLEEFLKRLAANPLSVLGHPPFGTRDPNLFRYSSDAQATISVVADLDEAGRLLRVIRIKIKVGGRHGQHR